jgi:DNA-directed RNA polymerase subunit beta'
MWSQANLLSPATGRAVAVPSQDMLLGLYVLTLEGSLGIYGTRKLHREVCDSQGPSALQATSSYKPPVFYDYDDVLTFLHQTKVMPFSFLWLRWQPNAFGPVISSREGPIEVQYDPLGQTISIYEHSLIRTSREGPTGRLILTTVGRVVFNQQIQQAIQEHIKYTTP